MRRRCILSVAILTLVTIFSIALPNEVYACICGPNDFPVEESSTKADAIFAGKVIAITEGIDNSTALPGGFTFENVTFEVMAVWKGASQSEVIVRDDSTDCAFDFQKGSTYLVYASGEGSPFLSTSRCSRTRLLSNADADIKVLGPGRDITRASPLNNPVNDLTSPALVFLVLFIFAVIGVLIFRQRARPKAS